jgi:hypothetical protein
MDLEGNALNLIACVMSEELIVKEFLSHLRVVSAVDEVRVFLLEF